MAASATTPFCWRARKAISTSPSILGANPIVNATDLRTGQTATFSNIEMLSFTDGTSIELVPRNQAPVVSGPTHLDAE